MEEDATRSHKKMNPALYIVEDKMYNKRKCKSFQEKKNKILNLVGSSWEKKSGRGDHGLMSRNINRILKE